MSLFINLILIVTILILAFVAAIVNFFLDHTKSGGQVVCKNGQTLVNGICKTNQGFACTSTSECISNLVCYQGYCSANTGGYTGSNEIINPSMNMFFQDNTESGQSYVYPYPSQFRGIDIRSESTDVSENVSLSKDSDPPTPYQEINGFKFCKGTSSGEQIIDACSYSSGVLFLENDGTIILDDNGKKKITNNIKLKRITVLGGYLYGLGLDGNLYLCENADFNSNNWQWSLVKWNGIPKNIDHISTPYDGKVLAVQNSNLGKVYNTEGNLISEYNTKGLIRIYGKSSNIYANLNLNDHTAQIYPTGKKYTDISDLAFNYHNEVVVIPKEYQNQYRRIAMVNWEPFFIN